jgi:hypothetical protein
MKTSLFFHLHFQYHQTNLSVGSNPQPLSVSQIPNQEGLFRFQKKTKKPKPRLPTAFPLQITSSKKYEILHTLLGLQGNIQVSCNSPNPTTINESIIKVHKHQKLQKADLVEGGWKKEYLEIRKPKLLKFKAQWVN